MQHEVLKLDTRDNVVIALADLHQGQQVRVVDAVYSLRSNVAAKHKFAAEDLPLGADVIMYGVVVGKAVKPVHKGRSEEHTSELQSHLNLVCRLLLEKKKKK